MDDTTEQTEQISDVPMENPYATAAFDTVNGEFIHGDPTDRDSAEPRKFHLPLSPVAFHGRL